MADTLTGSLTGSLFLFDDDPNLIVGHVKIGNHQYELALVKRTRVRLDFKGTDHNKQAEMFDDKPCNDGG